jgi:hypothetical protein
MGVELVLELFTTVITTTSGAIEGACREGADAQLIIIS